MDYAKELLITVDAGHGGWDNGASWNGRLEKDDNLRLALAVREKMLGQGLDVLMTRDSDVYVSLEERAAAANRAGADLFVSLHRNSYVEPTPTTNGVENFIYLTAPEETSGRAAKMVLDRVVEVGVQSDRGVSRGNFYVLRRTDMPAMLLEMGFIINEIDNQLFDDKLEEYAAAITKGVMQYFGLEYEEIPSVAPPVPEIPAVPELCPSPSVVEAQVLLNQRFGLNIPLTGIFDAATRKFAVMTLQMALNSDFNAGLDVDGIFGPLTMQAFPNVRAGQRGNVVFVIQALLRLNGYDPGTINGIFTSQTQTAVTAFQQANGLTPDGVVGRNTIGKLV